MSDAASRPDAKTPTGGTGEGGAFLDMFRDVPVPDRCVACTNCSLACPVTRVAPDYMGPRMMGPVYERFRRGEVPPTSRKALKLALHEDPFLHYCSNCKNCDIACPCGVPISSLIMEARASFPRSRLTALRDWILAHGETIGLRTALFPAALRNFAMNLSPTRHVLAALGVAFKAPLPAFASATFNGFLGSLPQPEGLVRKVAVFPGCYVNLYDHDCGKDLVYLLNRAGYRVVPSGFVCCGLPMIANGFAGDARANAETNMAELARLENDGVPVLAPCPSCVMTLNEDRPAACKDAGPPPVIDACAFVAGCIARGELALPSANPMRVMYHAPCHLRAQGIGLPGLDLLSDVPGLDVLEAGAGCCGISGSYGFKKEKYALAMSIGEELFGRVKESGAGLVVTECGTCRVQIAHGTGKAVRHPLSLLRSLFADVVR
ncbi:MAG: anaerobic glycerol-3-phosphate dehydrogenase subunit C [Desulfovibrio sp.]|jgi:glycerol-3-phosphate dehydrogenase subunit C|nr:anaerobic glycerol-3-phosphate dehydrogenase subunit C [Desulfovibrio sp.]